MIPIKRPPAPAFLTDPNDKWVQEIEDAKLHYKQPGATAYKFKMFNDKKLKDELKKVFVKCAYCESIYDNSSDGDVEHFRPKGKVKEKTPPTPGYYWLANDWDNLFLACMHCNQNRIHDNGDEKPKGSGKLDQFPLDSEAKRLSGPEGVLEDEEPARLLLNPCKDKPEEHIGYEKEEGVIVPITPKGTASVEVFALQRPKLVKTRKMVLITLFSQIDLVKFLLEEKNADPTDAGKKLAFDMAWNILIAMTDEKKDYAGMCRFFIKQFFKENGLL